VPDYWEKGMLVILAVTVSLTPWHPVGFDWPSDGLFPVEKRVN
jgi:hypothetical protein